jgi:hypothetical protein
VGNSRSRCECCWQQQQQQQQQQHQVSRRSRQQLNQTRVAAGAESGAVGSSSNSIR